MIVASLLLSSWFRRYTEMMCCHSVPQRSSQVTADLGEIRIECTPKTSIFPVLGSVLMIATDSTLA